MLRLTFYLCCLTICAPLLALQMGKAPPKTVPAIGTGKIDNPVPNAGIDLPMPVTDSGVHPLHRSFEFKGPVHGVRHYLQTGHGHPILQFEEEFDRRGRLIRKLEYERGVAKTKTLVTFSPRGNRTEVIYGGNYYSVLGYDARGRSISTRIYTRNGRGVWTLGTCETRQFDAQSRKVLWTDGFGPQRTRGWIRYTPAGKIARIEKVSEGVRTIDEYRYDAKQRIIWYKWSFGNFCHKEVTWEYDDEGTLITERCDPGENISTINRFRYNPAGKLLTRERYAWNYRQVAADGTTTEVITSPDKCVGDPPLYFRTVYTYNKNGNLQTVEHFDGNGAPAYDQYSFYPPQVGCCIVGQDMMAYSRVEYTYEKDGRHWTAYDAAGNIARRPAYDEAASDAHPPKWISFSQPGFIASASNSRSNKDRYGNVIRDTINDHTMIWTISYF